MTLLYVDAADTSGTDDIPTAENEIDAIACGEVL